MKMFFFSHYIVKMGVFITFKNLDQMASNLLMPRIFIEFTYALDHAGDLTVLWPSSSVTISQR